MRRKPAQSRSISEYHVPINDAVAGEVDRVFGSSASIVSGVKGLGLTRSPRFSLYCYPVTLQLLGLHVTLAYG